jgi:hypothetical protein
MAPTSSIRSFTRFASALAVVALAGVGLRGERARACGWSEPSIADLTTFDPEIVGDEPGLYYEPSIVGFGDSCGDCAAKAMTADWHGYLAGSVTDGDWDKILHKASTAELAAMADRLAGKGTPAPRGYEQSSLWRNAGARDRLRAALGVVELARRIEPVASLETVDPSNGTLKATAPPSAKLLADASGAFKAATDPFLKQRFAFLLLRTMFYRHDYSGVAGFFDKNASVFAAPSTDLAWRARYYVSGALTRDRRLGRANLELARIHAGYPALASATVDDFRPKEEADWREALRLATDVKEKITLWRLVGIKSDGFVAMQEIIKLDPKANVGLLMIRELAKAESSVAYESYGAAPDPAAVAAQKKAFAALEQIATKLAATPGADRPWLMELVAGHIAAKRGDLANARLRLGRAATARPHDRLVANQAKASLAVAIALAWKMTPQNEDELAKTIGSIDAKFARLTEVRAEVRGTLAKAYAAAGKIADAELLEPAYHDPFVSRPGYAGSKWQDAAFIKEMIARSSRTATEFDRFVVASSLTRASLEQDLALRYLVAGDFANAAQTFQATKATSTKLGTDPFVIHNIDCHDCDHEKYANAPWTHASLAARLVELEREAKGSGEKAAEAAFLIGNAMYNITWYGNARVVLENSHQATRDARPAERWYKRAMELSKNRELRAKAAFMAAKSELGSLLNKRDPDAWGDALPIPTTWFPIFKMYADTKYYKEVLAECGNFRGWLGAKKKP